MQTSRTPMGSFAAGASNHAKGGAHAAGRRVLRARELEMQTSPTPMGSFAAGASNHAKGGALAACR